MCGNSSTRSAGRMIANENEQLEAEADERARERRRREREETDCGASWKLLTHCVEFLEENEENWKKRAEYREKELAKL